MTRSRLKMCKKALCLIFAFLFSIESFAAVVSDNDGAAFITKAEFDSLKNSFQEQLDKYNTAIDSKIDLAISSYIAGLSVEKTSQKGIVIRNWTDYTIRNGTIANEYVYPDFDGQESYLKQTILSTLEKLLWMRWSLRYERPTSVKSQKKVLIDNVSVGTTVDTTNAYWYGVATNMREKWIVSRQDYGDLGDPGYLYDNHLNVLYACQVMNIVVNGYMTAADLNNISNEVWRPRHNWRARNNDNNAERYANGVAWGPGLVAINVNPSIAYEVNSENKKFSYEHLGVWNGTTTFECNIKDEKNYFKYSGNNGLRTAGWFSSIPAANKSGLWAGIEQNTNNKGTVYTRSGSAGSYTYTAVSPQPFRTVGWKWNQQVYFRDETNTTLAGETNNAAIPSIGLLGVMEADDIWEYDKKTLFDDNGSEINRIRMHQGIPVMQVKKEEKVEWDLIFKNVESTSTNKYVAVMLSYEPFGSADNPITGQLNDFVLFDWTNYDTTKYGRYRKGNIGSNIYYFPVTEKYNTTTKQCKVPIKFKADRDSIVYMKFFVYDGVNTSSINTTWEATFDVTNANKYMSTKE
ncbi:MAG: hypothetical protein J6M39_05435 [Lachnospiraceae bacterium]|nr:hypothetical protein [Lachnospiraceae bacterium]